MEKTRAKPEALTLFINERKVDLDTFYFVEGVHYKRSDQGHFMKLLCDVKCNIIWEKSDKFHVTTLMMHTGYYWDGASIPKCAQGFIGDPLSPEFALASLIHDEMVMKNIDHYIESWAFLHVLESRSGKMDIPWWKEKAMFVAVYAWSMATFWKTPERSV
jgi:hypothetical protein